MDAKKNERMQLHPVQVDKDEWEKSDTEAKKADQTRQAAVKAHKEASKSGAGSVEAEVLKVHKEGVKDETERLLRQRVRSLPHPQHPPQRCNGRGCN